jgi:hypothetical protein
MQLRHSTLLLVGWIVAAIVSAWPSIVSADNLPERTLDGLSWRLVGPQRAGWGTMAVGVADQPDVFYFGAAGGGVWKTLNAGRTWSPIFDHGPASIGALAVAASDTRVLYVGTGQVTSRYDIGAGEGVFKSVDGGASWHSVGLEATRHIGAIWRRSGMPSGRIRSAACSAPRTAARPGRKPCSSATTPARSTWLSIRRIRT